VRSFVERAFSVAGMTVAWEGVGVEEIGRCADTGRVLVRVDPRYFRPTEVDLLIGDASKAKRVLGWAPTTTIDALITEMVEADLRLAAGQSNRGGA
jgi:GDPmannose 4,6-dehydratase